MPTTRYNCHCNALLYYWKHNLQAYILRNTITWSILMEGMQYKVCNGSHCESYTELARDIESKLDIENVHVDPGTGILSFDNPRNCRVDEKLLEEAARHPERNIQFEVCE